MSTLVWIIIIIILIMLIALASLYLYRWYLVGQYKETIGNEPDEKVNKGEFLSVIDDINNLSDAINKKKSEPK